MKNRTVEISDCIFSYCYAMNGGAIFADNSEVILDRCSFYQNDAASIGRVLRGRLSTVSFNECDIGQNGSVFGGFDRPVEIAMFGGELNLQLCRVRGVGLAGGLFALSRVGANAVSITRSSEMMARLFTGDEL
ncbi:MAG: hypothetical protein IPP40_14610 [bacterium]|nr:hypothetical protein [bacterium]